MVWAMLLKRLLGGIMLPRVVTHGTNSPAVIAGGNVNFGLDGDDTSEVIRTTASAVTKAVSHVAIDGALRTMLGSLGYDSLAEDMVPDVLGQHVQDYHKLRERVAHLESNIPESAKLKQRALVALDARKYEEADTLLDQTASVSMEAAQRLHADIDKLHLEAAEAKAAQAELLLLRLRDEPLAIADGFRRAARLYQEAANTLPRREVTRRAEYLREAASRLQMLGDFTDAEGMIRQALFEVETEFGPDHPEVASALAALADWMEQADGRFEEAERLQRRALDIRKRTLGPKDRDVAASLTSVARLVLQRGQATEAVDMIRDAVAIGERLLQQPKRLDRLKANAPRIALAWALREVGCPAEGEREILHVIEIFGRELGPDHPMLVVLRLLQISILLNAGVPDTEIEGSLKRVLSASSAAWDRTRLWSSPRWCLSVWWCGDRAGLKRLRSCLSVR